MKHLAFCGFKNMSKAKRCDNSVGVKPFVVQVMPKQKFTKGFIEFTREAFPELRVVFILYGPEATGYVPSYCSDIIEVDSPRKLFLSAKVLATLSRSSSIILNWVDYNIVFGLIPYLSKTYLLFWGGDLYPYANSTDLTTVRKYIFARLARLAIRRAKGVLTLIQSDLCQVEAISKKHGCWKPAMITYPARDVGFSEMHTYRGDGVTRVLLGNSATATNRHEGMLRAMAHFSKENIMIYAPLSYGDAEYADMITALGKSLFGEKFIPLRDYMALDSYMEFLGTIDIGVFNHCRQQGMGNIRGLMRNGSKVFMAPDSGMYTDFKNDGLTFFSSADIEDMSFKDFIDWDDLSAKKNCELLDPKSVHQRAVELWRDIYRGCFPMESVDLS